MSVERELYRWGFIDLRQKEMLEWLAVAVMAIAAAWISLTYKEK